MFNNFDEHWKFWREDGISFPNAQFVHPCKQEDVQAIYDSMIKQDNIVLLVVFGSSVTLGCHVPSDVDIYIETRDNKMMYELPYSELKSEVDVVMNLTNWNYGVAKEIAEKGIVLFDRS